MRTTASRSHNGWVKIAILLLVIPLVALLAWGIYLSPDRGPLQEGADAQFELASMYYTGIGTPKDLKKAWLLFQKGAKQGHADSQYMVGAAYISSEGKAEDMVAPDIVEGLRWLEKAAAQGQADAQELLLLIKAEDQN